MVHTLRNSGELLVNRSQPIGRLCCSCAEACEALAAAQQFRPIVGDDIDVQRSVQFFIHLQSPICIEELSDYL